MMWLRTPFKSIVNFSHSAALLVEAAPSGGNSIVIRCVSIRPKEDFLIWEEFYDANIDEEGAFNIQNAYTRCESVLDYISRHLERHEVICDLKLFAVTEGNIDESTQITQIK